MAAKPDPARGTKRSTSARSTAKRATAKRATSKRTTATGTTAKRATAKSTSTAKPAVPSSRAAGSRRQGSQGALAAGAARASGERAKRRSTPLLATSSRPAASPPAPTSSPTPTPAPASAAAATESRAKHRPQPVAKAASTPTKKAVARSGARTARQPVRGRHASAAATRHTEAAPVRVLKAVTDDEVLAPTTRPALSTSRTAPGVEELLTAGISAVRVAAGVAGVSADDIERYLATMLSFIRRRVTGDYTVDEFGFDEDFTENFYLPVLRPLYRSWFRVEVRGIENIPSEGGALVVANHSGTVAMDSLMTQVAVHDEHPARRHLRMLGADLVFQTPVVGTLARKSGSTLAANPDAERLLSNGELCGVWPEGFKGVGKPFSERYKLQRFGRGGFVSAALRTGVPIIPCSIVGAEEIYPIIGNMRTVARLVGAPYAPITPTWPLLGPLGLIPLPSKWIIEFGSPVETADLGPAAADDPMLVFDLTDQVRETIQQTLYSLLMQRRSVFF
jgi:1-acyl-sn-glycerol-3-phosphate acyltransferase